MRGTSLVQQRKVELYQVVVVTHRQHGLQVYMSYVHSKVISVAFLGLSKPNIGSFYRLFHEAPEEKRRQRADL